MITRVYNEKISINENDTKEFWSNRGNQSINLTSVLLGADKENQEQTERNLNEKELLISLLQGQKQLTILDIGCGIGRWADNLMDYIESYTGIDYSKGFIEYAQSRYKNSERINFYEMSLLDIAPQILSKKFNLIICTGVLMYVNDNDISRILNSIKIMSGGYFYIQESVSLIGERLTLNNFESKDLQANYSAIYREPAEYENYFTDSNFKIINTDLLLDNKTGARQETNAKYWLLKG